MKNVKLLAEILNNVRGIKRCDMANPPSRLKAYPDCLCCMIANAIRDGINVPPETAETFGFSVFFGVSEDEADKVLFPHNLTNFVKGTTYYNKGKKLMQKYGGSL